MKTIRRPNPEETTVVPAPLPYPETEPVGLSRGNIAVLVAFFLGLAAMVVGSVVHLPYAVMSPGPTVNTLGDLPGQSKPTKLITIKGLPTYTAEGALDFTTVSVAGGPGFPVDLWDVLGAWIDPARDVLPVDDVFDPKVTEEQVAEENAVQMEGSQEEATAVALRAMGQSVPTYIVVSSLTDQSKAKDLLLPKDRLARIGDTQVTTAQSVRDALQQVAVGESATITVVRDGKDVTIKVPTIAGQSGRTALGIILGLDHDFPAQVTVNAGQIGGPSAGLMFSLGIYDMLTPGSLAGTSHIAGTGTIDDAGGVGPIGGIKQKMAGAHNAGAGYFLAPADNCSEVVGNIPSGLEVFRVSTFDEARTAVEAIASGRVSGLPRC